MTDLLRRLVRVRRVAPALLVVAALSTGCAGSDQLASATMQSGQRPSGDLPGTVTVPPTAAPAPGEAPASSPPTTARPVPGDPTAYCVAVGEFSASDSGSAGPDVVLDQLEHLQALGPDELLDDYDAVIGMVSLLADLEEGDPASLGRLLEVLMDPAVRDAIAAIGDHANRECGVDLGESGLSELEDGFGNLDDLGEN